MILDLIYAILAYHVRGGDGEHDGVTISVTELPLCMRNTTGGYVFLGRFLSTQMYFT